MSGPSSHHQIEELLGAFALDALETDERDIVDAHLAGCPRCRAEVATHRETAALLAHTGDRAPEGVWARISEVLEEPPPALDLARILPLPSPPAASSRRSVALRGAVAVVAIAAAVTAFLGVRLGRQDARLDQASAREQQVLRNDGLRRAALVAMAEPSAEELKLTSPDGKSTARVVRLPDGTGFVLSDNLAVLPPGRVYQLWAVRSDAKISLGVLGRDPDVSAFRMSGSVAAFAITVESGDGVATTENAPVVVGSVKGAT